MITLYPEELAAPAGRIEDSLRPQYLRKHLHATRRALES
jgi:beta-glucosidase/6-phospho-beta-glucosidase/beta-galactosidase